MRKQRVALEHHVDGALMRRDLRDILAVEQNAAGVGRLEAGQHSQQRGLAAAARTEQREELAGVDVERQRVDRAKPAECLDDRVNAQERRAGRCLRRRIAANPPRRAAFAGSSVMLSACPMEGAS